MARRSGLGKGLSALIPSEATGETDSLLRVVPISHIRPNTFQPRSHFDEESLASLAASIKEVGLLQPVLVRDRSTRRRAMSSSRGERRWRAARRAGLQTIPVLGPEPPTTSQSRAGVGREPAPRRPQRPRRGGGLPTADRRVRPHPRTGGHSGGEEPGGGHEHLAAPAVARRRAAGVGRGHDHRRARPGVAGHARPVAPGGIGASYRRRRPHRTGGGGRCPGRGPSSGSIPPPASAPASNEPVVGATPVAPLRAPASRSEAPRARGARARRAPRRPPQHEGEGRAPQPAGAGGGRFATLEDLERIYRAMLGDGGVA